MTTSSEPSETVHEDDCIARNANAIAVIGIGCCYPGANDIRTFWENILARRRQFRRIPDCRLPLADYHDSNPATPDKTYGTHAALIDGFEFDWKKAFVHKLTYETADITHWLALKTALSAIADAGLSRETVPTERSGVILGNTLTGEHTRATAMRQRWPFVAKSLRAAGYARGLPSSLVSQLEATMQDYFQSVFAPTTEDSLSGALSNTIAGRICNYLNLHGGGYTVDGACASSLIAVATAANALAYRELDFALAGGVDVSLDTFELIGFAKTRALTPDDMKVYDRDANGFIPGEGCGFVALKRLADARAAGDRVYAVIRGWGISSDGSGALTAPSAKGQAAALVRAYERAGYPSRNIDFFEGHGTGTMVGDRVELDGIALALEAEALDLRVHGVTSFKSLVGHTKAAAGIGGFIKAVIAVNRRVVPPTAGCTDPNAIFHDRAPTLYPVLTGELRSPQTVLRAGVSAMGFGGINCHVTLESGEPPIDTFVGNLDERALMAHAQDAEIFMFSGETSDDLLREIKEVGASIFGASLAEMADLSAMLCGKVLSRPWRAVAIANSPEELLERLVELEAHLERSIVAAGEWRQATRNTWFGHVGARPRLAFVFPGQGSQQLAMARGLIERHSWARAIFNDAERWLKEASSEPLGRRMFPPLDRSTNSAQRLEWAEELARTEIAQPAICLASLIWLRRLEQLGLKPDVVAGHSLGELTAFHAAGAFDAETLIKLAAHRGQAMAAPVSKAGAMASLACDAQAARSLIAKIDGDLAIANLNSPRQTVLSGSSTAINASVALAQRSGIAAKVLRVSNAFHSTFVASAEAAMRTGTATPARATKLAARLISGVDGREVAADTDLREHFARQITAPVDFLAVARSLSETADQIVEVGPGQVLSALLSDTLASEIALPVASGPGVWRDLLYVLARAFCAGCEINWHELHADRLIRPFTPAAEKTFIDNPCERPFRPTHHWERLPILAGSAAVLAEKIGVDADKLEHYVEHRGKFLASVIRADLDSAGPDAASAEALSTAKQPTVDDAHAVARSVAPIGTLETQLVNLVAKYMGWPVESLSPKQRLGDLLDSLKAGELVASAAKSFGVAGILDASAFADASLAELAEAIKAAKASRRAPENYDPASVDADVPPPESVDADIPPPEWVRCFSMALVPEPLGSAVRHDWNAANVLVVHEVCDADRAEALQTALTRAGAENVLCQTFAQAKEAHSVARRCYTHRIVILPSIPAKDAILSDCVSRLQMLTTIPRATEGATNALAVVQFGGGYFGAGPHPAAIDQVGAAALTASLHLERRDLRIRVVDADVSISASALAKNVVAEFAQGGAYARAGYDVQGVRRVPRPQLEEPATWPSREILWSAEDVVIVTGGARGITAECALVFARNTGARLALVGSSVQDKNVDSTLERFRAQGLTARYYRCDVCDANAVASLVAAVSADIGAITGVIHGAAVNKPRRSEQTDAVAALAEIGPKVQGALNLMKALAGARLKIFVGFTSIIGIIGMSGNAWYAFSNELLDAILRSWCVGYPEMQLISVAFGVWSGVGMGAREGIAHNLGRKGIGAIPAREGVERFLTLIERNPGEAQIVVTAQLAGLDTWESFLPPKPVASRYLDEVQSFTPGIQLRVRTRLDFVRDFYVREHVYKGSALFPAVFGLEAMAQAAAWVTGRVNIEAVVVKDFRLDHRIVVDAVKGLGIELQARVQERQSPSEPQRVNVAISTEGDYGVQHFAATYVFEDDPIFRTSPPAVTGEALAIEPTRDLYGWLLFQGARYQRLRRVYRLDSRECVLAAEECNYATGECAENYILGDPYFRDALLQSPQLTVPRYMSLPVRIDRIALRALTSRRAGERTVEAIFDGFVPQDDRRLGAHVTAFDDQGIALEEMSGYTLAVVDPRPDHPTPEQIAAPDSFDTADLQRRVLALAAKFGLVAPSVVVAHGPWHSLAREARRLAEGPHMDAALRDAGVQGARVSWTDSGRPVVSGAKDFAVSVSHDEVTCLFVAGTAPQGCDLAPLIARHNMEDWRALLGDRHAALLSKLVAQGDSLRVAGTRLWATREALRKANGEASPNLYVRSRSGDAVLFGIDAAPDAADAILTIPWRGLRGPQRIVAITLSEHAQRDIDAMNAEGFDFSAYAGGIDRGPQGQAAFRLRFPLGFREIVSPSGCLYFSNYFTWMGKLREAACQPVYGALVAQLSSGSWGMVTNRAETRILSAVEARHVIEGRLWLERLSGSEGSEMELCYEWIAERPNGQRDTVARSRMTATWVEILDRGVVKARPFPAYFLELMKRLSPIFAGESDFEVGVRPDLGGLLRQPTLGPTRETLHESLYETSQQDSNLVGNIYFSNYYVWQGRTVDRFFHLIVPEALRGTSSKGELFCAYSKVEHLREALPFDAIVVKMSLTALHENGVRLFFDYFRKEKDGGLQKLAWGEHDALWTAPDAQGRWRPASLPEHVIEALS